jgi:hypothetical protein
MGVALASGLLLFRAMDPFRLHVFCAAAAGGFAMLAHAAILRHLVASAGRVRREPAGEELEYRFADSNRRILPTAGLAFLLVAATLLLGFLAYTGRVSKPYHTWAAYAAAVYHVHATLRETFALFRTRSLIEEVDDLARRRADPAGSPPA